MLKGLLWPSKSLPFAKLELKKGISTCNFSNSDARLKIFRARFLVIIFDKTKEIGSAFPAFRKNKNYRPLSDRKDAYDRTEESPANRIPPFASVSGKLAQVRQLAWTVLVDHVHEAVSRAVHRRKGHYAMLAGFGNDNRRNASCFLPLSRKWPVYS